MMLAAALTGAQAFGDPIPTTIEGATTFDSVYYDGVYAETGDATGADVKVSAADGGTDMGAAHVYGGTAVQTGNSSHDNIIVMKGGEVYSLVAGSTGYDDGTQYNVYNNIVIMNGGKVFDVVGGENNGNGVGSVNNNQVVIAGGFVGVGEDSAKGHIWGGHNGCSSDSVETNNNTVSLVGLGASITIDDKTYVGDQIKVNGNIVVGETNGEGNTLSIAGSGIEVEIGDEGISGMQNLNFSLVDGLTSSMLVYNAVQSMVNLNLAGVTEYSINGAAVTDWTAYEGKTLTLIEAWGARIDNFQAPEGAVEIKAADGSVLATGELTLKDNNTLVLANIHSDTPPVPEPATGTLSLLALAGLCARRRRK